MISTDSSYNTIQISKKSIKMDIVKIKNMLQNLCGSTLFISNRFTYIDKLLTQLDLLYIRLYSDKNKGSKNIPLLSTLFV